MAEVPPERACSEGGSVQCDDVARVNDVYYVGSVSYYIYIYIYIYILYRQR